jgi:hypothetical protein
MGLLHPTTSGFDITSRVAAEVVGSDAGYAAGTASD